MREQPSDISSSFIHSGAVQIGQGSQKIILSGKFVCGNNGFKNLDTTSGNGYTSHYYPSGFIPTWLSIKCNDVGYNGSMTKIGVAAVDGTTTWVEGTNIGQIGRGADKMNPGPAKGVPMCQHLDVGGRATFDNLYANPQKNIGFFSDGNYKANDNTANFPTFKWTLEGYII